MRKGGVRPRLLCVPLTCLLLLAAGARPLMASENASALSGAATGIIATSGDPINMATLEFFFSRPVVDLGGPLPLRFTLYYGSQTAPYYATPPAKPILDGLPHNFLGDHRLALAIESGLFGSETITASLGLGNTVYFFGQEGDWGGSFAANTAYELKEGANRAYFYLMDPKRECVHVFKYDAAKRKAFLIQTQDRNGNALAYEYSTDLYVRGPDRISDGLGRELRLTYQLLGDTNYYVRTIQDQAGRTWTFDYEFRPPDNTNGLVLRALARPDGATNRFFYGGRHLLTSEIEPAGNWTYTNTYWSGGAVNRQDDSLGHVTRFEYLNAFSRNDSRIAVLNPDGTRRTFTHGNEKRALRSMVDEERLEARFLTFNPYGVPQDTFTNIVDRQGRTIGLEHDNSGTRKLTSRTDPAGRTIRYGYTNLTQTFRNPETGETVSFTFSSRAFVQYPDGTRDSFGYDNNGNVIAFTNQLGQTTRYGYNNRGQVIAITNAAGGTVTFGYDTNGNVVTQADSDSGIWSNTVDSLGQVTRIAAPDGTARHFAYDQLGRVTNIVDEAGTVTLLRYNANGNPTQAVAGAGTVLEQAAGFEYDVMNRLIRRVDAEGFATTQAYTWWGAVSNIRLPDGAAASFRFTPSRFPLAIMNALGHETIFAATAEGLLTGAALPDGRSISTELNALGRGVSMKDPLGSVARVARDDYERVTNIVDRLGRPTTLTRDSEGRITAIDLPAVGTARYAYNAIGSVTNVTDPRGNNWSFTHSALGRLETIRDSLGRTETFAYDVMGRVAKVTYADGSTLTNAFDARGALTNQVYSDGLTLSYAYDLLGRFIASGGAAPVTLAYDRRNRITNTVFNGASIGAAFDSVGRIASLDYGGGMTVTYAYDLRGLVTQVVDTVSGARVAFVYNANGELTRLERSNGVTTDFTRDAGGRVTRIQHGTLGSLQMTHDAEDRITRVDQSLPLSAQSDLSDASDSFTYDSANHLVSAGFTNDLRGRRLAEPGTAYTWDGADRLVTVSNASGVVGNVYTASGDLARRVKGAVTNDFVHTYSLPLRPMLIEKRNGVVQRYYVHTTGGKLLYHVDVTGAPAVRFHHYDHLGTTVFLTDGVGAVTDSYAYTAYGRLVRHNGPSTQPFTYLGTHGIRTEEGTELYHSRARWYDSRTARFISFDPKWMEMLSDPLQINPYQYVRGSPVMGTDVTGEYPPAPVNDLWKFTKDKKWELQAPADASSPWRTPQEWIETFTPPPNPRDSAIANWLRNREQRMAAWLLPGTDEPQVIGETVNKPPAAADDDAEFWEHQQRELDWRDVEAGWRNEEGMGFLWFLACPNRGAEFFETMDVRELRVIVEETEKLNEAMAAGSVRTHGPELDISGAVALLPFLRAELARREAQSQ